MKDSISKKRSIEDVTALVDAVVARDFLPMPTPETFAIYDGEFKPLPMSPDGLGDKPEPELENLILTPSSEELTGFPCCELEERVEVLRVDRKLGFVGMHGFHSSYHTSTKYRIRLVVEKTDYRVETLEHIHSGKRLTADLSAIGPDRSKASWDAIAFLVCIAIQSALPIDRLRKLFGSVDAFSGASISRYLEIAAQKLLPIYLYLIEQFARLALVASGDDCKTRVLKMEKEAKNGFKTDRSLVHDMVKAIEGKLGRVFLRKDGNGPKTQLNVSHVHGLLDPHNPRSIIYIFRTHFGSVGNLISQILKMRPSNAQRITFQGDLSSTNFPNKSLMQRWIACIVGCASHARRAFFRFKESDDGLCDRILELFAMISAIEKQMDQDGRTPRRILDYRKRLAEPVWNQIIALATCVLEAERLRRPKNRLHFLWPKGSKLYQACQYIVSHRLQLTAYIYDYRLAADNNRSERMLRGEKILLVACKFRLSETGRVTFDVLRSLLMTAVGACGDPKAYFTWALRQKSEDIKANPQFYTPLCFYELNEAVVDQCQYFSWYLKQPKDDVKSNPHSYSPLAFRKILDESATKVQATGS